MEETEKMEKQITQLFAFNVIVGCGNEMIEINSLQLSDVIVRLNHKLRKISVDIHRWI